MWPLDHIGPSDLVAGHGIGPEGGMDLLDLSLVVSLSFMEPPWISEQRSSGQGNLAQKGRRGAFRFSP